jgi:hypothetical protein
LVERLLSYDGNPGETAREAAALITELVEAAELMIAAEQCGGDLWWKGFDSLKAAYANARGEQVKL